MLHLAAAVSMARSVKVVTYQDLHVLILVCDQVVNDSHRRLAKKIGNNVWRGYDTTGLWHLAWLSPGGDWWI